MQELGIAFASLEPATWKTVALAVAGLALTHFILSCCIKYKARHEAKQERILDNSPLWDRNVASLQVTDTKQHTIEVRIIVSARDAGQSWDLRCELREKLINYLQKHHPESLPRIRTAFASDGSGEEPVNLSFKRPEHRSQEIVTGELTTD